MSAEINTAPRPLFARRLVGGTLNYGLGSILPQVVGFLLIPFYTAFLTPADYGILDLTAAFGAILVVLMRFGVPGAVTRFYFDHHEGTSLQDYVSTINRFLWISSIVMGALALGSVAAAGRFVLPGVPLTFSGIVILTSLLSSNTDLQRRLIQAREQSRYSVLLSLSFALVNMGLAVFFVGGLHWGCEGMLLAQLVTGVAFFVQARLYLAPELVGLFRAEYVGPSLHYGLGILPSHLLANLAPFVVRSMLATEDSLDAVGLFGIAWRFTSPMLILFAAFSTAFLPVYFAARKEGSPEKDRTLARVISNTWSLALFLFLVTGFLAPPAIQIMTPHRFHAAIPLVRILSFGFLGHAIYLLLTPEIFFQKKTWMISLISFTGVVVNVLAAFLLLKRLGIVGVAWASVLGYASSGTLAGVLSMRIGAPSLSWRNLAMVSLSASAVSLLMLLHPHNPYLEAGIGVAAVLVFVGATAWTSDSLLSYLLSFFRPASVP